MIEIYTSKNCRGMNRLFFAAYAGVTNDYRDVSLNTDSLAHISVDEFEEDFDDGFSDDISVSEGMKNHRYSLYESS